MRHKEKKKIKSLSLAVYFGLFLGFIFFVSISFKAFDVVRKSKFDGENRFTLALVSDKNAEIISVSPQNSSITKLVVKNLKNQSDLSKLSVPLDSVVKTNPDFNANPNTVFLKLILKRGREDVTIVDLVRLAIFAGGVSVENVNEADVSINDDEKINSLSSTLFIDPNIQREKLSIQITNSTQVSGLGNRLAKYLSNMGGNIVLVNTSQKTQKESKIYTKEISYTAKKISREFNIEIEKSNRLNSISDVFIIIGEDRKDMFNK